MHKVLEINRVCVQRGRLNVLKDVTLKVNEEEFVALVGSNGSGKTTLLSTIAGLLKPSSGVILFMNEPIHLLRSHEIVDKGVALVPEGRRIFGDMTVLQNLLIGSYCKRARRDKRRSLELVFELFPRLRERANQIASTLSGGEQQMLAIGRAIMSRPKLLLLDEISQGLAPSVVTAIYDGIQKIRSEGVSCLVVEQHVREIFKRADRIYVLRNGRITLEGKPSEIGLESVERAYFGV